jgi:small subunit ribosomal protein S16
LSVRLRLRRGGRKKKPIYTIVATDGRSPRDGKFIEELGQYMPLQQPMGISVKETRVLYWLKRGAQPSDTVRNLLSRKGIWLRWSLMKKGADEAKITEELGKWEALQAEKASREIDRKARRSERKKKAAQQDQPVAAEVQATPDVPAAG